MRPIRHRPDPDVHAPVLRVPDDSDDLAGLVVVFQVNRHAFAEWLFVREVLSRERLVDDDDVAHLRPFLIGEESPAFERDLHRAEVVRVGHHHAGFQFLHDGQYRPSLDVHARARVERREWQSVDRAGGFDAWQRLHLRDGLPEEVDPLLVVVVLRPRQAHAHRQYILRVKAGINSLQPREAANEQPRAKEQNERYRDFENDQRVAQPLGPHAARALSALFERLCQVEPRRLERRREAEDDAGRERYPQCEAEHRRVDLHLRQVEQIGRGERYEQIGPPPRQRQSGQAAQPGEQQTLGQQLPDDATAIRAQRSAHGNFPPPPRGARQQQVGNVRAGDQEHHPDRAEQHEQRQTNLARELRAQRNQIHPPAGVEIRVLLLYPAVNSAHLGLRLLQTEAGFDPSHRHGATSAPRAILFVNLPGRPYLRLLGGQRAGITAPVEARRHHADHRGFIAAQDQFAPDDLRVAAEPPLPQSEVDHDHAWLPRLAFVRREGSPQNWGHAEYIEKAGGGDLRWNLFRLAVAGQVDGCVPESRHILEDAVLLLPVEEVPHVDHILTAWIRAPSFPHHHQPVGVGVRQGLQQHGMHYAEDRRIRADAERQRDHGHDRERRLLEQRTRALAQVLPQSLHSCLLE